MSNNPALTFLNCQSNNLTSLNVKNGTNENITYFNAKFNHNLACIKVDDATYSDVHWPNKDDHSYFDMDCNLFVNEEELLTTLTIYPNPTTDYFTIDLKNNIQLKTATIYSISGMLVSQTHKKNFNMEGLQSGLYILQIETDTGTVHKKIAKN